MSLKTDNTQTANNKSLILSQIEETSSLLGHIWKPAAKLTEIDTQIKNIYEAFQKLPIKDENTQMAFNALLKKASAQPTGYLERFLAIFNTATTKTAQKTLQTNAQTYQEQQHNTLLVTQALKELETIKPYKHGQAQSDSIPNDTAETQTPPQKTDTSIKDKTLFEQAPKELETVDPYTDRTTERLQSGINNNTEPSPVMTPEKKSQDANLSKPPLPKVDNLIPPTQKQVAPIVSETLTEVSLHSKLHPTQEELKAQVIGKLIEAGDTTALEDQINSSDKKDLETIHTALVDALSKPDTDEDLVSEYQKLVNQIQRIFPDPASEKEPETNKTPAQNELISDLTPNHAHETTRTVGTEISRLSIDSDDEYSADENFPPNQNTKEAPSLTDKGPISPINRNSEESQSSHTSQTPTKHSVIKADSIKQLENFIGNQSAFKVLTGFIGSTEINRCTFKIDKNGIPIRNEDGSLSIFLEMGKPTNSDELEKKNYAGFLDGLIKQQPSTGWDFKKKLALVALGTHPPKTMPQDFLMTKTIDSTSGTTTITFKSSNESILIGNKGLYKITYPTVSEGKDKASLTVANPANTQDGAWIEGSETTLDVNL